MTYSNDSEDEEQRQKRSIKVIEILDSDEEDSEDEDDDNDEEPPLVDSGGKGKASVTRTQFSSEQAKRAHLARLRRFSSDGIVPDDVSSSAIANAARASASNNNGAGWSCVKCTYINEMDVSKCEMCLESIPFHVASGGAVGKTATKPPTSSNKGGTKSRKAPKCGACGQAGHTRTTATRENCSMYDSFFEMQWRKRKHQELRAKVQHTRDDYQTMKTHFEEQANSAPPSERVEDLQETILRRLSQDAQRAERAEKKMRDREG